LFKTTPPKQLFASPNASKAAPMMALKSTHKHAVFELVACARERKQGHVLGLAYKAKETLLELACKADNSDMPLSKMQLQLLSVDKKEAAKKPPAKAVDSLPSSNVTIQSDKEMADARSQLLSEWHPCHHTR
jgi:hypothetical protein